MSAQRKDVTADLAEQRAGQRPAAHDRHPPPSGAGRQPGADRVRRRHPDQRRSAPRHEPGADRGVPAGQDRPARVLHRHRGAVRRAGQRAARRRARPGDPPRLPADLPPRSGQGPGRRPDRTLLHGVLRLTVGSHRHRLRGRDLHRPAGHPGFPGGVPAHPRTPRGHPLVDGPLARRRPHPHSLSRLRLGGETRRPHQAGPARRGRRDLRGSVLTTTAPTRLTSTPRTTSPTSIWPPSTATWSRNAHSAATPTCCT